MKFILKIAIFCLLILGIAADVAPSRASSLFQAADAQAIYPGKSHAPSHRIVSMDEPVANVIFIPMFYKGADLYNSGLQVVNLENTEATITITGYSEDGDIAFMLNDTLPPSGSVTYFQHALIPNGFVGSLVISSNVVVSAYVNIVSNDFSMITGYNGRHEGSNTVLLPLLQNNVGGFTSVYSVQNTGSSPASVQIEYSDGLSAEATIPAGAAKYFYQDQEEHDAGTVFSAVVTSDQPLVTAVLLSNNSILFAHTGFNDHDSTVSPFFPMIQKDNNDYVTGIQLQNVGDQATDVTVEYIPALAGDTCQETMNIPAGNSVTFALSAFAINSSTGSTEDCNLGETFIGSARVIDNSTAQPLIGLANLILLGVNGDTYRSFTPTGGSDTVVLPLITDRNSGFNTTIAVQHIGGPSSDVTCTFSDSTYQVAENLELGHSLIDSQENKISDSYVGSGRCQAANSATQIVAVIHQLNGTSSMDQSAAYEGINIGSSSPPPPPPPPSYDCSAVAEIPQIECEALVALYENSGGPDWDDNTGWLQTKTPCSWHGVICRDGYVTQLQLSGKTNDPFGLKGHLPSEIGNLSKLIQLIMEHNEIQSLPSEIGKLTNLTRLFIRDNKLSSVPAEIGGLSSLKLLRLNENQITALPDTIGKLTRLTELLLSQNELSTVPDTIGDLENLVMLTIYRNQLDSVPPTLGDLLKLKRLYLDENHLTKLPAEIWTLPVLENLGLSGNKLSEISADIGNLTRLTQLYLNDNQLGTLPAEMSDLKNLKSNQFNIGYNRLQIDDDLSDFLTDKDSDWAETQTIVPANFSAEPQSNSTIKLTWTPITYTDHDGYYEISYATSPDGPYTMINTDDKLADEHEIADLDASTTYHIRIRTHTPAHDIQQNDLWSDYSEIISAATYPEESPYGEIHGMKWRDDNGNGIQDPDETGLEGWTISLENEAGTVITTTTTDADGNYWFMDLPTDTYAVSELQQDGWTQTYPPSITHIVNLGLMVNITEVISTLVVTDINFGNQPSYGLGEIHGMKWHDENSNGIQDEDESGLSDWTILLENEAGVVVSVLTDADGNYSFAELDAGVYTVTEVIQTGWAQTYPTGGLHTQSVEAGDIITGVNFGNWQNANESCTVGWNINIDNYYDIDNTVEVDMNIYNNSGADANYRLNIVGYPGFISNGFTAKAPFDPAQPDPTPPFFVRNMDRVYIRLAMSPLPIISEPFGQYQVIVTNEDTGYSFGCSARLYPDYARSGKIRGTKWHDKNGNGLRELDEPGLEGWTILLSLESGRVISTTTDADGNYAFHNLFNTTYNVAEVLQPGWAQTYPSSGVHTYVLEEDDIIDGANFGNWQKSDEWCSVGWDINVFNDDPDNAVEVGMRIYNQSSTDANYSLNVVGYPGFTVHGFTVTTPFDSTQPTPTPPVFVQSMNSTYVAVFMSPLPIFTGASGRYQVIVTNEETGYSFSCSAQLWQDASIRIKPKGDLLQQPIRPGIVQEIVFEIHNLVDRELVAKTTIEDMFGLPGAELEVIRLDDQAVGTDIIDTVTIPASGMVEVAVAVELTEDTPNGSGDIILYADIDEDGEPNAAASVLIYQMEDETANVYVQPADGTIAISELYTVEIRIDNIEELYGNELSLSFDPDIVEVVDADDTQDGVQIQHGDFFIQDTVLQNSADNAEGIIQYSTAFQGDKPGIDGSGVLARIVFRGLGAGTSPISFTNILLSNPRSEAIEATDRDGEITVVPSQSYDIMGQVILERRGDDNNAGAEVCVGTTCITTGNDGSYELKDVPFSGEIKVQRASYLYSLYSYDATQNGTVRNRGGSAVANTINITDVTLLGGDINQDGIINIDDAVRIGQASNSTPADPHWHGPADVTDDNEVNLLDMVAVQFNWDKKAPGPWGDMPASTSGVGLLASLDDDNADTQVTIDPATITIEELNGTAELDITITDATDLYGFTVRVSFDATKVQVVDANPNEAGIQIQIGEFLDSASQFVADHTVDNERGKLELSITQMAPAQGKSGSGVLGTVNFKAVDIGQSAVNLDFVRLLDNATPAQVIPVNIEDGILQLKARDDDVQLYLPVIMR